MIPDEHVSISEYHCCCDCINILSVPSNYDLTKWELACRKKRPEVNRSGGLTYCPVFEGEP